MSGHQQEIDMINNLLVAKETAIWLFLLAQVAQKIFAYSGFAAQWYQAFVVLLEIA